MKISFLKNGNFKYKKEQLGENIRALVKAMGFKDSEDNIKMFRIYLGIDDGRKPLLKESFNDYYKRTLKLFLSDMQKEAKRKLKEEGIKPIVNGRDVLHKFDNVMHSIAELHNDEIEKQNKELHLDNKKEGVASKENVKKQVEENKNQELNVPKIIQSKPKESYAPSNNNRETKKKEPVRYFDERYGWTQFLEEDTDEKKRVEEYLRRLNQFQRINIEHYANYTENQFRHFLYNFFRIPESDAPGLFYNYDPNLVEDIEKEEMKKMFNVSLTSEGKVKDFSELKSNYKNVAQYYLNVVEPTSDYVQTPEKITKALEKADEIVKEKIPNDPQYRNHLGLKDKEFNELKNEMMFQNAQYSLKWIYAGTYDKPLDTIQVREKDRGEENSKAFLAINLLKGIKEIHDNRKFFDKRKHKEEETQISEIEKFLTEKVGLSKEFIDRELKDEMIKEKMGAFIDKEALEKAELEKVAEVKKELVEDSNIVKKSIEKTEPKLKSNEPVKEVQPKQLSMGNPTKKKNNN